MTPPRGNGHQLPLVCDCGHEGLELMWHASDCPIKRGTALPRLGEIIRDAERLAAQMLAVLKRDYDPASAPSDDDPHDVSYVTIRLKSATADVRSALLMLSQITDLDLPPAGSAVHVPGPPLPDALDEGDGPPSHDSFSLPTPPDWHWLNTK